MKNMKFFVANCLFEGGTRVPVDASKTTGKKESLSCWRKRRPKLSCWRIKTPAKTVLLEKTPAKTVDDSGTSGEYVLSEF